MKKRSLLLASALLCAGLLSACGGSKPEEGKKEGGEQQPAIDLKGDYAITVWQPKEAVNFTTALLNEYKASVAKDGINLTFTVEEVGEGDAASKMIEDVEKGADIYNFAQDQLARLVNAKGLSKIAGSRATEVSERNDAGSVSAATVGDSLYAFPLTSDNGYFMYYDKSVIKESSLDSMEAVLADAKAANKLVSFNGTSAWYNAAYFFATGCTSEWTTDKTGEFVSYKDTYNSDKGVIAAKGLHALVNHDAYNDTSDAKAAFEKGSAVVVSGTWDYEKVKAALGDNLGATKLPKFTVDGKSYQLGSFGGYKLVGVKPQTDAKRSLICSNIANFLTDEAQQLKRFESLSWGPSNKVVQKNEKVLANPALKALAEQSAYAIPQGQFPQKWWDVAGAIASDLDDVEGTDEVIKGVLTNYEAAIAKLIVKE